MIENYLKKFSEALFQNLKNSEQLSLHLHSEESLFYRFNQSKVRQNTTVNQHELTLQLHANERLFKMRFNLTLNLDFDLNTGRALLENAREQVAQIDAHPQFFKLKNNGSSQVYKKSVRPSDEEIPRLVQAHFQDADLAGLWCSGPLRQASVNSEGQFHFFETDNFFFDYSIYNGPLAAKGYYSSDIFNEVDFAAQASLTKNKLSLLNKPALQIPRGQYNVYLEPMAVLEILTTLAWSSFSQAQYMKGLSPLKKLKDRQVSLSPLIHIQENFDLGISPRFNSVGELSPLQVPLISQGQLNSFLISTSTAQEYQLQANGADVSEMPRSIEIRAGTLKESDILKKLDTGLYLSNLHYINYSDSQSARITGMTRFACFWVEKGEIQGPIQDLRFDESIYKLFGENLLELTENSSLFVDTGTYLKRSLGAFKTPGALIKNFNFTL